MSLRGARNVQMKLQGDRIDEGIFVYISHRDMKGMRKEIFHDRASYGAHNLRFSSDSGSG